VLIRETERILIKPLSLDDAPALTEILSDPEVMKHSVRGVCDESATVSLLQSVCLVTNLMVLALGH